MKSDISQWVIYNYGVYLRVGIRPKSWEKRIMAKRNTYSFKKYEKELKRKKKAKEKLDRRQGKKDQTTDDK